MNQKQKDKVIKRAINFIKENTNEDSKRIGGAIIEELRLVEKLIIPVVMPRNSKSEIILRGLQVKSLSKAKKLAAALDIIEEECGIKNVKITVEDVFFCGWIDKAKLNETEMEKLLCELIEKVS